MSDNRICDGSCNARVIVIDDKERKAKRARLTEGIRALCARTYNVNGTFYIMHDPVESAVGRNNKLKDMYLHLFGTNKLENKEYLMYNQPSSGARPFSVDEYGGFLNLEMFVKVLNFQSYIMAVKYEARDKSGSPGTLNHDAVMIKMRFPVKCSKKEGKLGIFGDYISEIYIQPSISIRLVYNENKVRICCYCSEVYVMGEQRREREERDIIMASFPDFDSSVPLLKDRIDTFLSFCRSVSKIKESSNVGSDMYELKKLFKAVMGIQHCHVFYS